MTLYIAKHRRSLVNIWPVPNLTAGLPWQDELQVWDDVGLPADLSGALIEATIFECDRDDVLARASVSQPETGTIRWSFDRGALTEARTAVYRFALDVDQAGDLQRLVDARVPIRNSNRMGSTTSRATGFGPATATIAETAPLNPVPGQLWWQSTTGNLMIWYIDVDNTRQWVMVAGPPT